MWEGPALPEAAQEPLPLRGARRIARLGDPAGQECVERHALGTLAVDVGHLTVSALRRVVGDVLDRHHTAAAQQATLCCLIDGVPLLGADLFEMVRARAAAYPEGLARAMVESHAVFYPRAMLDQLVVRRTRALAAHQLIVQTQENILGILLGVNRRLGPSASGMLFDRLVGSLPLAPVRLPLRFRRLLDGPLARVPRALDGLVLETLDLAERHVPGIDLDRCRAAYLEELSAWPLPTRPAAGRAGSPLRRPVAGRPAPA